MNLLYEVKYGIFKVYKYIPRSGKEEPTNDGEKVKLC